MIELILKPYVAESLLMTFGILTPVIAILLKVRLQNFPKTRFVILMSGPIAVGLWLLQLLLISTLGFAAVATYLVLLVAGLTIGLCGGVYLRDEYATR